MASCFHLRSLLLVLAVLSTARSRQHIHLIQYGPPRTATTFQFHTLCAMAVLNFPNSTVDCAYEKWHTRLNVLVTKTHDSRKAAALRGEKDTYFFGTSLHPLRKPALPGTRTPYTYLADLDKVSQKGSKVVREYRFFFSNISDTKMDALEEYFDYWDTLRVCCGKQMSKNCRAWLTGPLPKRGLQSAPALRKEVSDGNPESGPHSGSELGRIDRRPPICLGNDIGEVERRFISTDLYTLFGSIRSGVQNQLTRPSSMDEKLDGSYCKKYAEGTGRYLWKQNEGDVQGLGANLTGASCGCGNCSTGYSAATSPRIFSPISASLHVKPASASAEPWFQKLAKLGRLDAPPGGLD